ncbi:NTP transferase domain-containing protein [Acidisphaera sp. L21]|uniref:phosphocholine cytidylyltransferase family protein n=1 Tax=Acidisphaera sp. L21 TaxID=1641851 RepID=UPI00131E236E|nr:phosphocholine cytidylyltransferase family protein [Acidisphaera sp. L21]
MLNAVPTKALILAAGVGRRLSESEEHRGKPKALLHFQGASLMARHIAALRHAGITDITVIAGFAAGMMQPALAELGGDPAVAVLVNPDFREGSVVSLWTGRDVLRSGAPVILMDADVLYDDRLMARLVTTEKPDCLLLDREIEPGDEPVKLCIANGRIVDFHKRPTISHEWHGESVGFFRFTAQTASELADRADAYVTTGRRHMEYEEPIRDMILESAPGRFGFEDITGLPWTEIDFPEDVVKANNLLPELAN